MMISQEEKRRKFESGPKLTPEEAVKQIKKCDERLGFRRGRDRVSRAGAGRENHDGPETSGQELGRI